MPCNSDYIEPYEMEVEHANVLALLEELDTGHLPYYYGLGYYPPVYRKTTREILDAKVAELCRRLKMMKRSEIDKCSPEMRFWWRKHVKADKERSKQKKRQREHTSDDEKSTLNVTQEIIYGNHTSYKKLKGLKKK